jgi:two-component system chemotaxis sensor kinase CheA
MKTRLLRQRGRYTLYGALFGALFPIGAFLILTFVSREVTILFGVICSAPLFLGLFARLAGVRQDRLDTINRELEALVDERTKSIQSLLDVSGQGFLSFDPAFVVGPEYSRECERIFGGRIEGKAIDELLFASARARAEFRNGLGLYFQGTASADVIFDLQDRQLVIGRGAFRAEYRAINEKRVMVILTDVTEQLRREEESREENERRNLVLKAIANKRTFRQFDREAEMLFAALEAPRKGFDGILRDVHSFKGNAGFLGFRQTQESAHRLEDLLADSISLGEEVQPAEKIGELRAAFARERAVISDALGAQWIRAGELVEIPRAEYLRIETHVRKNHPSDRFLIAALEGHRMTPLRGLFDRFPLMAREMASRLGKRAALEMSGGESAVAADEFDNLVSSFAHILRNMIDHGIEPPAEREAAGKPTEGRVRIDIAESPGRITFTLSDDGRGVRLDEVERKARETGLIAPGEQPAPKELLMMIFRDGFSTSRVLSVTSGRGVGLPAVHEAVRSMGGRISVKTSPGRGTTFTVIVPRRRQGEAG